jgi:hypothetical protein
MRRAAGVMVFLLLLVFGAAVIGVVTHVSPDDAAAPPEPPPPEPPPPPAVGSQWRYTSPRAPYASQAGEEACAKSLADITIGGGGRSGATLCLRRGGGYPYAGSIVLGDTRGQFVCPGCVVKARFDERGTLSFNGTAASTDGTSYALFIRDGAGLAAELKRASSATFEVSLRGAAGQQVAFNVAGLRWPR